MKRKVQKLRNALIGKRLFSAIVTAFTVCVLVSHMAAAGAQTSGAFSVRAVIPENQIDTKQTYFDLKMSPGEEQELEIIITNSRTEELRAEISLNAASTGRNGHIVYTAPDVRDESMELSVTDVARLEKQSVTVPPNSAESVKIFLTMPGEPFAGVLLGGINVRGSEIELDEPAAQGVSLKNTFSYVVALKLTQSDTEPPPDFELRDIRPSLVNYSTSVVVALGNLSAHIAQNMRVNAEVYEKGSDTVLRGLSLDAVEMAPLSTGDFVIDWQNQKLRPGDYRLKMTAEYKGKTWSWDEEFVIADEVRELNDNALGLKRNYSWIFILLGLVLLALIFIIAYRMGKRVRS